MKLNKNDIVMIYWAVFALITFIEWSCGKGPEVGLATGMAFVIVRAFTEAVHEIRKYWIHRVTERYRA